MGYYTFPHTRTYDTDLGWLICQTKKLLEMYDKWEQLPDMIKEILEEYINSGEINDIVEETIGNFILNPKYPPSPDIPKASGDGTTDDTESIQGCIDYASENGGVVYLPHGSYLTQPLVMKDGVSLFGFDRYSTKIVLKGGATKPLIGGTATDLSIMNLTLDGNSGIQVNDVDVITLMSSNVLLENLIVKDGYNLFVYNGTGGHLQIDNVIFDNAVEKNFVVAGNCGVQVTNSIFNQLSAVSGICVIEIGTNNGYYEFRSTARCDKCIVVSGNDNEIIAMVQNATTPVTDTGLKNNITITGISEKQYLSGDVSKEIEGVTTETYRGDRTISEQNSTTNATKKVLQSTDLDVDTVNPVKYKTPTEINNYFGGVPMLDRAGDEFKLLTDLHMSELVKAIQQGAWLNAVSYGCDNTGVTDCTNLINEMLLTGKPIVFPAGTYLVSDYLLLQNGSVIFGYGATFKGVGNDKFCFFADGTSNILVVGVDVTYFRRAFDFRNGSGCTLIGVSAHDMYREASSFEDNYMCHFLAYNDIVVCNATWDNLNENGDFIRLKDGNNNVIIENCNIHAGDDGIALVPDEGVSTIQPCTNVLIKNCTFNSGTFRGMRIQSERSLIDRVIIENCEFVCDRECAIISSTSSGATDGTRKGLYEQIVFKNCKFTGGQSVDTPSIKLNTATQARNISFENCYFNTAKLNQLLVENCNIYGLYVDKCRMLAVNGGGSFITITDSTVNIAEISKCYASGSSQSSDKFVVIDGETGTIYLTDNRLTGFEYLADFIGNTGTTNLIVCGNLGGYNYLLNSDANVRLYGSITSNSTSNTNINGTAIGVINGLIKTEVAPSLQANGYVYIDGTNNKVMVRLNNQNQSFDTTVV